MRIRKFLYLASVSFFSGLPAVGAAQDASAPSTEEASQIIIVTAEKRATNLQDTALALSVASGDSLRAQQVTSILSLAQTMPNVHIGEQTGNARIAVRGIGFDNISLGAEGRVAYHLDGVYISRPAGALSTFYDVDRVEVLRGPQGTLYGRNATGGVLNVITTDPGRDFGGYFDATAGNYGLLRLEGAVQVPLSETLSARIAFQAEERDGYGYNFTADRDIDDASRRGIRAKIKFAPTDSFDLTLSADYYREDDAAYGSHYLGVGSPADPTSTPPLTGLTPKGLLAGGVVPINPRDSTSDVSAKNDREFWGLAMTGRAELGAVELKSITAFRSSKFDVLNDLDGTDAPLNYYNQIEESETFSQELQLSGEFGRGNWSLGGFYFHESIFAGARAAFDPVVLSTAVPLPPLTSLYQGYYSFGKVKTDAYALFANLNYELTSALSIKAGLRYSYEKKRIDEQQSLDFTTPFPPFVPHFPSTGIRAQNAETWSSLTPSVTLSYKPDRDLLLYLTYSRGFKSGGFNLGNLQPPFAPEKITDYEAGLRASLFDRRLQVNLSAFYYDYSNIQVTKIANTTITTENAASAKLYGMEAELTARPVDRLTLQANLSLLHSEYKDYRTFDPTRLPLGELDLSGNHFNQAPSYTVNVSAAYAIPTALGDFELRGEGRWVDKAYFTQFNTENLSQGAHSLFNAFLSWKTPVEGLSATAFVRNIGNKRVISSAVIGTALVGSPVLGGFEPPRTYGLTIGYKF